MSVTNYKFAGTASGWTNSDYAKADDTDYSTMNVAASKTSTLLNLTNFGFSSSDLPTGCTINGIEFIISRKASITNKVKDSTVKLALSGGVIGNDLASTTYYTESIVDATYGGASNMCGTTLTQTNIVSNTFGVSCNVWNTDSSERTAYCDYIKIRVYYTAAGGSPVFIPGIMRTKYYPPFIGGN